MIGVITVCTAFGMATPSTPQVGLVWEKLPALPDQEGFAAPFVGVSGETLLVGGGANFPGKRPWEGGTKVWYDTVFALSDSNGAWRVAGHLPRPNAYGVGVTYRGKLICVGGGDSHHHFADVFALGWDGRTLSVEPLPSLPKVCSFVCGALIDSTLYLAGGLDRPDALVTMQNFWSLDLSDPRARWRKLPPWPGRGRAQATAGAAAGYFYLVSGYDFQKDSAGKVTRVYLRDAYRYHPQRGWQRIADLPRATLAAATPAPTTPDGRLLILSGDDGVYPGGPDHPGLPREVLVYDPTADRWANGGSMPFGRSTVSSTVWQDRWMIPSGEARPGFRSNEVWSLQVRTQH